MIALFWYIMRWLFFIMLAVDAGLVIAFVYNDSRATKAWVQRLDNWTGFAFFVTSSILVLFGIRGLCI